MIIMVACVSINSLQSNSYYFVLTKRPNKLLNVDNNFIENVNNLWVLPKRKSAGRVREPMQGNPFYFRIKTIKFLHHTLENNLKQG